jgi:hypothetical protein
MMFDGRTRTVPKKKHIGTYTVDLTKLVGKGDFLCPHCGTKISPDDKTENSYSIIEPKVNGSDLEEVLICCNRCGSQITLTGFSMEQELAPIDQESALTIYVAHL